MTNEREYSRVMGTIFIVGFVLLALFIVGIVLLLKWIF